MTLIDVGTFEIKSGKMNVTDPCYNTGTWCGAYDLDALNGKWHGYVNKCTVLKGREQEHERICELIALHESELNHGNWVLDEYEIGVDSGQAGVFDSEIYPKKNDGEFQDPTGLSYDDMKGFYAKSAFLTLREEQCGILDGRGIVSSAGWGDGGYNLFTKRKNGKLSGVKIVFIDELDDE